MAKEFCTCVAQRKDDRNFSWVIRGLGDYVTVIRVESVPAEEMAADDSTALDGDEWEYNIYHTGPEDGLYAVPGKGFVFADSPRNKDGDPIPRPWEL